MSSVPLWATIYPTLETLALANFTTLDTWVRNLPKPQTDVERTVWRRLQVAYREQFDKELKAQAPDIHSSYHAILAQFSELIKRAEGGSGPSSKQ